MHTSTFDTYRKIYSTCHRTLGEATWGGVLSAMDPDATPQQFPETLAALTPAMALPAFITDLARIEWALHAAHQHAVSRDGTRGTPCVNPSLTLIPAAWRHIVRLVTDASFDPAAVQAADGGYALVWREPDTQRVRVQEAEEIDLLALKIVVEDIPAETAAASGGVGVGAIESALRRARARGLVLGPDSRIRRRPVAAETGPETAPFLSADVFTLQWHITQACDLHCKHCYDRSDRTALPYHEALAVLDDFRAFCREMHVAGQISFTGGNPLLYPRFDDIYRKASELGFGLAILGNPAPMERIQALTAIEKPLFYQISLEGLEAHNDSIRGEGHFRRSLKFLEDLKAMKMNLFTMVMLTLTKDNLDQVLDLADLLRERADFFTFNRLATVGEGAALMMSEPRAFRSFLEAYEAAARKHPILGLKDNLFNIVRLENGRGIFGGCTGYGCGAAFNFVALLPDGEVHACRKFPSRIGDLRRRRLTEIYLSDLAQAYRGGSRACRDCRLNLVCRGCPAITYSQGLDIFEDRDPFCFLDQ